YADSASDEEIPFCLLHCKMVLRAAHPKLVSDADSLMNLLGTTTTSYFFQDRDPVALPVLRVATKTVLSDQSRFKDYVEVRTRLPFGQIFSERAFQHDRHYAGRFQSLLPDYKFHNQHALLPCIELS